MSEKEQYLYRFFEGLTCPILVYRQEVIATSSNEATVEY